MTAMDEIKARAESVREDILKGIIKQATEKSFFDICALDKMQDILGATGNNEAYVLLNSFHCWSMKYMPKDIKDRLPQLIREAMATRVK